MNKDKHIAMLLDTIDKKEIQIECYKRKNEDLLIKICDLNTHIKGLEAMIKSLKKSIEKLS